VLSNIRKGQGGSFVFFDFGNAAFTWRASELAVIHQTLRRHASGELYDEVWSGLLRGYRRTRELPDDFSQHLPLFDLLRKVSWICGVMASCPLRMGTETFNPEWVSEQMPSVRELARCLAT
jgi:Ser/Thr protein kinase RdoA (MazF antagonist)